MLALVPAMTLVHMGLTFLPDYAALAAELEHFVFQNFVSDSSALVREKLN
jgi:uncharacterized BrkB/YihY/UPF0761 family membrane protein